MDFGCSTWTIIKTNKIPHVNKKIQYSLFSIATLQTDVFPRFVRSKLFMKEAEKFKKNKKVMTLSEPWKFPYTDEDFRRKHFVHEDIAVARTLLRESYEWNLVSDNKTTGKIYLKY